MPTAASKNPLALAKGQDALFERGFKTWCENTAESIRKKMHLKPWSSLDPRQLADQLGVKVWDLSDIPDLATGTKDHLSSADRDEWSAVTVNANEQQVVVINPTHSPARQASDLMHELAHVILEHSSATLFMNEGGYALRTYDEKQEAEANWFAGCLLLPRAALTHCVFKRMTIEDAIDEYGVSRQLYTYRSNKTGVNRQFKR